jgi:hypothetical protein
MLQLHIVDEPLVDAFETDRPMAQHQRHRIAGPENVGEARRHQHALRWARDEAETGLEHGNAGAFGADERAGEVEALLRQQLVEIVAGDAARYLREALADELGIAPAQRIEPSVDLAAAAAFGDDPAQFLVTRRADAEPQPVIGEDVQLEDVVGGAARHHGMDAAGIVADHAAERVVVVRRRIGAEGEMVRLGGVSQIVEYDARLDPGEPLRGVDGQDMVEVFGVVDDHRSVAALARQARAAAARQEGRAMLAAERHGGEDIPDAARDDDTDRHLSVVRAVGRIERSVAPAEPHFAGDATLQRSGERRRLRLGERHVLGRFARAGGGLQPRASRRPAVGILDDIAAHLRPPAPKRQSAPRRCA